MKYSQVWDLTSIFKGGSLSSAFSTQYTHIEQHLILLNTAVENGELSQAITLSQQIHSILREMDSFVECLIAQNIQDTHARILETELQVLNVRFSNLELLLNESLKKMPQQDFESLLEKHPTIRFNLQEKRSQAADTLSCKEESSINELAIDGYHGWSQLWQTVIGEMRFPFQGHTLSFGQIENKLADPKPEHRCEAFKSITREFTKSQTLFAQTINHLSGFRLAVYKQRGWAHPLKEPLEDNRMTQTTLHTIWETIDANASHLIDYLKCKAELLKKPQLDWFDLEAPLATSNKTISFDDAATFIIKQFNTFSPQMATFAKHALNNCWIEAEDRCGKSPGGFCTGFPVHKESRIFMTFSNTMTNLFTLAHELGHAFHNHVIFELPEMAQHIKSNVAETASTMAEMIVTKAAIQEEPNDRERLALLDDHLSRSIAYLMNIRARFLFEETFYNKRKQGFIPHQELSALMEHAQKSAYQQTLASYHPLFWATKMHFYLTDTPFYNFPYTFGYLFSLGIYTLSQSQPQFENNYVQLLKNTGQMSVESLAKEHLNVDLQQPDFWQQGLDVIKNDINTFIHLSNRLSAKP